MSNGKWTEMYGNECLEFGAQDLKLKITLLFGVFLLYHSCINTIVDEFNIHALIQ